MRQLIIQETTMLKHGLDLFNFCEQRSNSVKEKQNNERFKAHYGSMPAVYAALWSELHLTEDPQASVVNERNPPKLDLFLMTIHFLKCYPTENQLAGLFRICEKSARTWIWFYLKKIQALKPHKIMWPEAWDPNNNFNNHATPIFLISVDGTHCHINEPKDEHFSKNPKYYSHKFSKAALNYEIGLSVYENKIVWVNGPKPAGSWHDITLFRENLKMQIPEGRKVIGDRGYRGEPNLISTPNAHDPQELRKFKSRARARHETLNGRLKNFRILDTRFRHGTEKHQIVFEAICVIVQYQLELGSALFEV